MTHGAAIRGNAAAEPYGAGVAIDPDSVTLYVDTGNPQPDFLGSVKGLRPLSAILVAFTVLAGQNAASAADRNAHDEAVNALRDLEAAIGEVAASADLTISGAGPYKQAAQRAINALVGRDASEYLAEAGNPGDQAGALGHLNWLLQRSGKQRWEAAIRGSWVNATVAKARLDAALRTDELSDFQESASSALEALLVALGHESDFGGPGGLRGRLPPPRSAFRRTRRRSPDAPRRRRRRPMAS